MSTHPQQDPSPGTELHHSLCAFTNEVKQFRSSIEDKLSQQEKRLTMLDQKSVTSSRPPLAYSAAVEAPHQKAFAAYLRSGDEGGLRGLAPEGKSMSSAMASDGGYLVDPQTSDVIGAVLTQSASLRQIAQVVQVDAASFDVLVDHGDLGAGWAAESGARDETDTGSLDRISIALHELSALPKVSQRLLDDSAFDVEGWLAARIADKFARAEGAAFITGDGVEKPRGILSYPTVANDNWAWGSLGHVATGEAGALGDPEVLIDLVYALGARYRAGARFVMNSRTAGALRKLKDGDGRFLWTDGFAEAQPARLLGYPVVICEDMPDIAADASAVAFGDFGAGYTIAERPDLRLLRDPFSAKPHVLFYATKRIGGGVSDFAAIKLLKFAVN